MKRIYIACPLSIGKLADNVNKATATFHELRRAGFAPFCPAWSAYAKECEESDMLGYSECFCIGTRGGHPEMNHDKWMKIDLAWVEVSDAVLRLPGESVGADTEVKHAFEKGIPVFYSIAQLIEHVKGAA